MCRTMFMTIKLRRYKAVFHWENSLLKLFLLLLLKLMALNVLEAYALYLHVFARKVLKQLLTSFPGRGDSNLLGEWK